MDFLCLYNMYRYRINKKLNHTLNRFFFKKSNLFKAMKYSLFSGGKRLRPCLVYGIGKMLKVNINTLDVIASAIECIHIYSLIHDDLPCMDNDDFRRGKKSCHVKYNENVALLAGNALQSLAFNILSKNIMPNVSNLTRINMIAELSNTIGFSGMCIGQMLDIENKKDNNFLYQLDIINLHKTAFLIRSAIRLASFSSKCYSKSILCILDRFSIFIGLAFQIKDDILDINNDLLKVKDDKKTWKKSEDNIFFLKKRLEKFKKKMKMLYKKAFLELNNLKRKNFDINFLQNLTKFIVKI